MGNFVKPFMHNNMDIPPRCCLRCCISCRCAERRTNCESCTVACARNMENYRGGHRCNITGDDPDNGQSPRLRYCYSCCNKRECDKLCEVYHDPQCEQIRWEFFHVFYFGWLMLMSYIIPVLLCITHQIFFSHERLFFHIVQLRGSKTVHPYSAQSSETNASAISQKYV